MGHLIPAGTGFGTNRGITIEEVGEPPQPAHEPEPELIEA